MTGCEVAEADRQSELISCISYRRPSLQLSEPALSGLTDEALKPEELLSQVVWAGTHRRGQMDNTWTYTHAVISFLSCYFIYTKILFLRELQYPTVISGKVYSTVQE